MAHRSKIQVFSPLALAVGLSVAMVQSSYVTPCAWAQSASAGPPQVLVYILPEWHLQDVYAPLATPGHAVAASPSSEAVSDVRTASHQTSVRTVQQSSYPQRYAQVPNSNNPSAGSYYGNSPATVYRTAMAQELQPADVPNDPAPLGAAGSAANGDPDYSAACGCEPYGEYCGPQLRCIGGMEFTFLKPVIDDGTLVMELEDTTGIGREEELNIDDFDAEQFDIAPRFWVGLQGDCWGVVTRFWRLDDGANEHSVFLEGIDLGYDFASELEMYTIDLEATRTFCYSDAQGLMTFGVRHAHAERAASLDTLSETTAGQFISMARFGQTTDATGLTGSISAAQPIWCGSRVRWYYNVRGSILWGNSDTFVDTAAMTEAGAFARNGALVTLDDEMFIGEAQLGLRWDHRLECSPATVFFRTGFEYQHWSAQGGSAIAESFVGIGNTLLTTTAAMEEIDLNLFGYTIATGLNW